MPCSITWKSELRACGDRRIIHCAHYVDTPNKGLHFPCREVDRDVAPAEAPRLTAGQVTCKGDKSFRRIEIHPENVTVPGRIDTVVGYAGTNRLERPRLGE